MSEAQHLVYIEVPVFGPKDMTIEAIAQEAWRDVIPRWVRSDYQPVLDVRKASQGDYAEPIDLRDLHDTETVDLEMVVDESD